MAKFLLLSPTLNASINYVSCQAGKENKGFRCVLAYWQVETISCNLAQQFRFSDGGINVQWKQPFLSVSLSLLPKFLVHKLGLSLITPINCFKFFKMVLLSPFWNGIKMGDHRTLKKRFNNLFNNILDGQSSFFHWELISFHPLCNFIAVTTRFYFVIFK